MSVFGHTNRSVDINVGELKFADKLRLSVILKSTETWVSISIGCDTREQDLIQVLLRTIVHLMSTKSSKMVVTSDLEEDSVMVLLH